MATVEQGMAEEFERLSVRSESQALPADDFQAEKEVISNIIRKKLNGFVGFANFPNQWHRKSIKLGFNLNVMIVGSTGLGKATCINTLFNRELFPAETHREIWNGETKPVSVEAVSEDIEEGDVKLHLTVINTPHFGEAINNEESWKPIVENIESRFDDYLESESKVNRSTIVDTRIHACIYFIEPTGHSLKALDVTVMKQLHTRVNLIPVIAKADTLTPEEIDEFKKTILDDIRQNDITIFQPPAYEDEEIPERENLLSKMPFAIVGSSELVSTPDGREVRGRKYPWGIIEVDNPEHNDFVSLRQLLIRSYLEDLRENTANVLYENYRSEKLKALGVAQDDSVFKEFDPNMRQEEQKALHEARLAKMEAELKNVFEKKVAEKEQKLKNSETELFARHREMKEKLNKQLKLLEEKKKQLESARNHPVDEKVPKVRKGFSLR